MCSWFSREGISLLAEDVNGDVVYPVACPQAGNLGFGVQGLCLGGMCMADQACCLGLSMFVHGLWLHPSRVHISCLLIVECMQITAVVYACICENHCPLWRVLAGRFLVFWYSEVFMSKKYLRL